MQAANITGTEGTLNTQAKSAARSAFESAKQRFFGHLLTKLRFFVPIDGSGPAVVRKLRNTYPVARISKQGAA